LPTKMSGSADADAGVLPQMARAVVRNSLPARFACVFLKNAPGIPGRHQEKDLLHAHRR
jgi:hypothetical protein